VIFEGLLLGLLSGAPGDLAIHALHLHPLEGFPVLAPFLDTYPGSVECGSARKGNSDWSAGKLSIRVVADEEAAGCG